MSSISRLPAAYSNDLCREVEARLLRLCEEVGYSGPVPYAAVEMFASQIQLLRGCTDVDLDEFFGMVTTELLGIQSERMAGS